MLVYTASQWLQTAIIDAVNVKKLNNSINMMHKSSTSVAYTAVTSDTDVDIALSTVQNQFYRSAVQTVLMSALITDRVSEICSVVSFRHLKNKHIMFTPGRRFSNNNLRVVAIRSELL